MTLAHLLHALHEESGVTQERVAHAAGLSTGGYSELLSGVTENPKLDTIFRLCAVLKVKPGKLLDPIFESLYSIRAGKPSDAKHT